MYPYVIMKYIAPDGWERATERVTRVNELTWFVVIWRWEMTYQTKPLRSLKQAAAVLITIGAN